MNIRISRSVVIDAPIERVWAQLRDFSSQHRWHPAVADSELENGLAGDVVGAVRRYSLTDGAELREQLLHHSDRDFSLTYSIVDSSLPLLDHVATLQLKPVTDGDRTYWAWSAQFRAPDDRAVELETVVGSRLYDSGIAGLRRFLADRDVPLQVPVPGTTGETAPLPLAPDGDLPSKRIVVKVTGGPETMILCDDTVAAPLPGQVRIRQTAIAVNYLDIMQRQGLSPEIDPPWTPGVEGVGEVINVGKGVNGLFAGDRVAYISATPGAYAEIRCIDANACIALPQGVPDLEASMLLKGITAGLLLDRVFGITPGATILIQAAAGGLGHLLSQWAKSLELTVIGTVSTAAKAKFSRDRGCDHPIVVRDPADLVPEVMRITNGHGVDFWVQSDGGRGIVDAVSGLARCGHLALIGDREGLPAIPLDMKLMQRRSLTVSAPLWADYIIDRLYFQRLAHHLFNRIQHRSVIPAIETFPLSRAAEVHRHIEARRTMGAAVLTPGG